MIDVDVLVLGAGPAGEAGAMNASKRGKSVVVVDQRPQVGGNCTHKGTIPSRALREAVKQMIDFNTNPMFKDIARAQITNESVGMLKILFHPDTLEILGVHCFGDQASEIVHIGQAIMNQPGASNSLAFFANTTFNYPTMAEAYRVAAINGLNRVS